MTEFVELLGVEFGDELERSGYQMTEALVRAAVSQYLKARIRKLDRLEGMTPGERRRQLRQKRDHGRKTRSGEHVPSRVVQIIKDAEPRPSELRIIEPAEVWGPEESPPTMLEEAEADPEAVSEDIRRSDAATITAPAKKTQEKRLEALKEAAERRQEREDTLGRLRR